MSVTEEEYINPRAKAAMVEYSNLNIRAHMTANPGIVFAEHGIVRQRGISYMDHVQKKAKSGQEAKLRITRGEYAKMYGGSPMDQVFGAKMGEARARSVLE